MTTQTLLKLIELLGQDQSPITSGPTPDLGNAHQFWQVGKNYLIQTVTLYYTGKLVAFNGQELILDDAAWIPDIGRAADAYAKGSFSEVEPYPSGQPVAIGRGAVISATVVAYPIPRSQK